MKATVYTEFDPAETLQPQEFHQEFRPSVAKVNVSRQSFADALIQFIVRRPRSFILVYGCGPALVALWLFIGSVQNSEWLWAIAVGSWLMSIVTCVTGIHYLISIRCKAEI